MADDICEQTSAIQAGILPLNAKAWNFVQPAIAHGTGCRTYVTSPECLEMDCGWISPWGMIDAVGTPWTVVKYLDPWRTAGGEGEQQVLALSTKSESAGSKGDQIPL